MDSGFSIPTPSPTNDGSPDATTEPTPPLGGRSILKKLPKEMRCTPFPLPEVQPRLEDVIDLTTSLINQKLVDATFNEAFQVCFRSYIPLPTPSSPPRATATQARSYTPLLPEAKKRRTERSLDPSMKRFRQTSTPSKIHLRSRDNDQRKARRSNRHRHHNVRR